MKGNLHRASSSASASSQHHFECFRIFFILFENNFKNDKFNADERYIWVHENSEYIKSYE